MFKFICCLADLPNCSSDSLEIERAGGGEALFFAVSKRPFFYFKSLRDKCDVFTTTAVLTLKRNKQCLSTLNGLMAYYRIKVNTSRT